MKKYVTVIGEITAETFQRYAVQTHVGPKMFTTTFRANGESISPSITFSISPEMEASDSVLISSPGGDIGYTLAILDDIDYWKRTTLATGICQSAAAVLATAGEGHRICTMDALFRFMPAQTEIMNDPESPGQTIERVPDLRHYLQSVLVARIAQRLKIERIEAQDMFDGKFITSLRAKELGLIDEVISTEVSPDGNFNRFSGGESETASADSPGCLD